MDIFTPSIIDHLEELRFRLIRSLLFFFIALVPSVAFAPLALNALVSISCPPQIQLTYIRPMELFFTELEVALVLALILALPVISFQLWRFVSPGLHTCEKKTIIQLSGFSCVLFITGAAFALLLVFPAIMEFSLGMETPRIKPNLVIDGFVSLALALSVGFGLMFQLPIVVVGLVRLGLVEPATMAKCRPFVVTVIFILAAILTPPDVISQLTLGIPTWLLFEISLLFCRKLAKPPLDLPREAISETAHNATQETTISQTLEDDDSDDFPLDQESYGFQMEDVSPGIRNLTPGNHSGTRGRRTYGRHRS